MHCNRPTCLSLCFIYWPTHLHYTPTLAHSSSIVLHILAYLSPLHPILLAHSSSIVLHIPAHSSPLHPYPWPTHPTHLHCILYHWPTCLPLCFICRGTMETSGPVYKAQWKMSEPGVGVQWRWVGWYVKHNGRQVGQYMKHNGRQVGQG